MVQDGPAETNLGGRHVPTPVARNEPRTVGHKLRDQARIAGQASNAASSTSTVRAPNRPPGDIGPQGGLRRPLPTARGGLNNLLTREGG